MMPKNQYLSREKAKRHLFILLEKGRGIRKKYSISIWSTFRALNFQHEKFDDLEKGHCSHAGKDKQEG